MTCLHYRIFRAAPLLLGRRFRATDDTPHMAGLCGMIPIETQPLGLPERPQRLHGKPERAFCPLV